MNISKEELYDLYIVQNLMKYFEGYSKDLIIETLFDMNKYFDKELKKYFKELKKETGKTLDSFQRKLLRNYYYHPNDDILQKLDINKFPKMSYTDEQLEEIINITVSRINTLNSEKIINSIKTRIKENNKYYEEKNKATQWLNKYSKTETPSLILLNINQKLINDYGVNYESNIYSIINIIYKKLNNYRYTAIIMKDDLYYEGNNITWDLLSNIAIYMENFINFEGNFFPFKKKRKKLKKW